ncbi:MAG TPA: phage holin family protein [Cyclobacteriaceae bacterium]
MNFLVKILLSALGIIIASYILPGVDIKDFLTATIVALILAILNVTIKPLMIILTIPLTVITLGIFLLVINAILIVLADALVPGFEVDGFWWAFLFSLILAILNSLFDDLRKKA